MSIFSKEDLQDYNEKGYVIARNLLLDLVQECILEIKSIFAHQGKKLKLYANVPQDFDDLLYAVMKPGSHERHFLYNISRNFFKILSLQSSSLVSQAIQELDFRAPIVTGLPTVRFDFSNEEKFLRDPHQDLRAIRSKKAVTAWIPLRSVNKQDGTLVLYPGTQRHDILYHYLDPNLRVADCYIPVEHEFVQAEPGDVVLMNSFCIHRSHPGTTRKVKIVVILGYNDAEEINMGDKYHLLEKEVINYGDVIKRQE